MSFVNFVNFVNFVIFVMRRVPVQQGDCERLL